MKFSHFLIALVAFGTTFFVAKWVKRGVPTSAVQTEAGGLELNKVAATLMGTKYAIPIGIEIRKGCFLGEVDVAQMDLAHAPSSKIYLTVESLSGALTPVLRRVLLESELLTGVKSVDFEIPASTPATTFGVFVCRDSSSTGSCLRKGFGRLDEAVANTSFSGVLPKYEPEDRLYYSQLLFWSADHEAWTLKGTNYSDTAFQGLDRNLASISVLKRPLQVLRSHNLEFSNGVHHVKLGKHDSGLCKK